MTHAKFVKFIFSKNLLRFSFYSDSTIDTGNKIMHLYASLMLGPLHLALLQYLDYGLDGQGFKLWQGQDIFLFSNMSELVLEATYFPVELLLPGALPFRVK